MKMKTGLLVMVVALGGFMSFIPVMAAELSKEDASVLQNAGIPVYPNAVFYGEGKNNDFMGLKFMTSDPVDKVRKWYADKLTGWPQLEYMGSHSIYRGKPVSKWMELFGRTNVVIDKDEDAHKWYDELSPDMTTRITVTVMLKE